MHLLEDILANGATCIYLREKQKYSLPGIPSLQRWASRLEMRKGILTTGVLIIMSIATYEMSNFEKVTVI